MTILFFGLTISLLYAVFIFWCLYYWKKIPDRSFESLSFSGIKVAVIIPARDEALRLTDLLDRLIRQDYPASNVEYIVVDDHSSDDTYKIAENYFSKNNILNGRCFHSPLSSKKSAITHGISKTNAELIITTDADTLPGSEWVSAIVREYSIGDYLLISCPVKIKGNGNYFQSLQRAEFSGLVGIGAAAIAAKKPIMCNGANLAFSKKVFVDVNGYNDSKSSSGDDTQLLLKVHEKYPGKISFLKDTRAIVETCDIRGNEFIQQRRRWASKIPSTLSPFAVFIAVFAWFVHATLLILFIAGICRYDLLLIILPIAVKTIPEVIFLNALGKFFNEKYPAWLIVSAQPMYWLYISAVGVLLPFGKFRWKGRSLK
jgi:cellulose synthase/poly-beta-1,6-N-acetylglucosamine synthase-like glycosyltransferase